MKAQLVLLGLVAPASVSVFVPMSGFYMSPRRFVSTLTLAMICASTNLRCWSTHDSAIRHWIDRADADCTDDDDDDGDGDDDDDDGDGDDGENEADGDKDR